MTPTEMIEHLRENYPECLLADGFEDALIGLVDGACRQPVACYDFARCVEILMARGMSEEDAIEYLDFNTLGAYVGEYTPLFLHDWRADPGYAAQRADLAPDPARERARPVWELDLEGGQRSVRERIRNCLEWYGKDESLHTLGDLADKSETELLRIKNLGKISVGEIKLALARHGLKLRRQI